MRYVVATLALALPVAIALGCGRVRFDERPRDAALDAPVDLPLDMEPPNPLGCADGEREGFVDRQRFPLIAGCAGTWVGARTLREAATGATCGDDAVDCASVGDLCAAGWHVCAANGDLTELAARAPADDCRDGGGSSLSFVAAAGHCVTCNQPCSSSAACVYAPTYGCDAPFGVCTEPVCCGASCALGQVCLDGAYAGQTGIAGQGTSACGAFTSDLANGVLCCAD